MYKQKNPNNKYEFQTLSILTGVKIEVQLVSTDNGDKRLHECKNR